MPDASPDTPTSPRKPAAAAKESCAARLLALVRKLIDYGRELTATLLRDPENPPRDFGTKDIALILARITQGLHRAQVLEERLVRKAARLDAPPPLRRAVSARKPRTGQAGTPNGDDADPPLAQLPTPDQIAARVRRQPIGAVLADICRDLGIFPDHPLWPEISELIRRHGGNLTKLLKEIIAEAGRRVGLAWIAAGLPPGPLPPSPLTAGTGPPNPRACPRA